MFGVGIRSTILDKKMKTAVTLFKVHFSNRYSYTDFLSIQKLSSNSGGGSFSFTSLKNQTSESAVRRDLRVLVII